MAIRVTRRRIAATASLAMAGLAFVALATFMLSQGLDRADQLASVIAGFVGVVSLTASAISLTSAQRRPPAEDLRRVTLTTAWGTYRLREDLVRLVEAQARAAQSLPYRVPELGGMPMATMYVRQDLELHRQAPDRVIGERIPLDRMEVRSAEQMQLRILPMAQTLEHVMDRHRHLLVEGGPGLGKSSLARDLVARMADAWLTAAPGLAPTARPVLPLLVSARSLARHRAQPWVTALAMACAEQLGQHADDAAKPATLTGQPSGVAWLVVIDGLDEVTEPQRDELLEVIAARMAHTDSPFRIIVLSRPLAAAARQRIRAVDTGVYALLPFSSAALHDFVAAAFSALRPHQGAVLSERFLDQLRTASLDDVATVPLLATIAIVVFASDPRRGLPRTRYELYEQYIAHLAEASSVRRRHLRVRLRQRASQLSGGIATVDALFDRSAELIEYVAVSQVHTEEQLIEVAVRWCQAQGLFGSTAFPGLRDAVSDILTSTGLLVRRDTDVAFIHHTFAEHFAADHHARELPAPFDHRNGHWRTWLDRAAASDDMARAALVRWTRRHPESGLIAWLNGGSETQQFLATILIANGAAADEAQIAHTLAYIEATWATINNDEILDKELRRFPRSPAVLRWAASILGSAAHNPGLQAAAARLLAGQTTTSHVDAEAVISHRLLDDLLPTQRAALASTLASIAPERAVEAAASLLHAIKDELATPRQRAEAAHTLFELGPSHRGRAAGELGDIVDGASLSPIDRAAVARALAEFVPERREDAINLVRVALADSETSTADRPMLAQLLAELGDVGTEAEEILVAAANDIYLDGSDRIRAARTLADLGANQRRVAAATLTAFASQSQVYTWHRRLAAQRLVELGAEHHAAAATVLRAVMEDAIADPWQQRIAAQTFIKLAPHHRGAALVGPDHTTSAAEDVRTSAAVARAVLDPAYLPKAIEELTSIASNLYATDDARHNAASMLAGLGQESIAAACGTLLFLAQHASAGWARGYAAYWLAILRPQQQQQAAACFRDLLADPRLTPEERLQIAWYMLEVISSDQHHPARHLHQTLLNAGMDAVTRLHAAGVLLRLSRPDHVAVLNALAAVVHDPSTATDRRLNAGFVLIGRDRGSRRRAAEGLLSLAHDQHAQPAARSTAAELLGSMPKYHDQACRVLTAILADPHTAASARATANSALDHLEPSGRPERLAMARSLLADPDTPTAIRLDVVDWLSRVDVLNEVASDALQAIAETSIDWENPYLIARVFQRRGRISIERAAQTLRRRLSDPYLTYREVAAMATMLIQLAPSHVDKASAALSTMVTTGDMPPRGLLSLTRGLLGFTANARHTAADSLQRVLGRTGIEFNIHLTATQQLGEITATQPRAIAAARRLLSDPRSQPDQRREVAEFIADRHPDDPDASANLHDLLLQQDLPTNVRVSAALALVATCPGHRETLDERLRTMLTATSAADRMVAAVIVKRCDLDRIGDAVQVLADVAQRGEPGARWHAVHALATIPEGRPEAASAAEALLGTTDLTVADRCRVARLMATLGPIPRDRAAAELIGLLADTTHGPAERLNSARTLGQISPAYRDVAAAHLHAIATLPWPSGTRALATVSLADLSPIYREQAADLVSTRLHVAGLGPAQRVRAAAELAAISLAHAPKVSQTLLRVAQDESLGPAIRFGAARHLTERRLPAWHEAARTLEDILAHRNTPNHLRLEAARTLIDSGRAHRQAAVAALTSLMDDRAAHPHDRLEAATTICGQTTDNDHAIGVLRGLAASPASAPRVRRRAALRLGSQDPSLVAEAATILREIHGDLSAPAEIRAHAASSLAVVSHSLLAEAAALLRADLAEGRPGLRLAAARRLSDLGPTYRAEADRHFQRLHEDAGTTQRASTWIRRASAQLDRLDDLDP